MGFEFILHAGLVLSSQLEEARLVRFLEKAMVGHILTHRRPRLLDVRLHGQASLIEHQGNEFTVIQLKLLRLELPLAFVDHHAGDRILLMVSPPDKLVRGHHHHALLDLCRLPAGVVYRARHGLVLLRVLMSRQM